MIQKRKKEKKKVNDQSIAETQYVFKHIYAPHQLERMMRF
jgi:hypothetical protein